MHAPAQTQNLPLFVSADDDLAIRGNVFSNGGKATCKRGEGWGFGGGGAHFFPASAKENRRGASAEGAPGGVGSRLAALAPVETCICVCWGGGAAARGREALHRVCNA